jgi:hypothetical protein
MLSLAISMEMQKKGIIGLKRSKIFHINKLLCSPQRLLSYWKKGKITDKAVMI